MAQRGEFRFAGDGWLLVGNPPWGNVRPTLQGGAGPFIRLAGMTNDTGIRDFQRFGRLRRDEFKSVGPDVYVGNRGDVVAVRGGTGKLSVMRTANGDTFPVREWLAADADARTVNDRSLKDGVTCDEIGCLARLRDGAIVALPFAAEAFEEDCRRAALVVSQRTAPPSCAATAVDRAVWRQTGAVALYRTATGWERVVAYPPGYDRPWARAIGRRTESDARPNSAPRDATPRSEDLSADD